MSILTDWRDIVSIASFLFGIFGVGIAIYSNRKMRTAQQAEEAARQKLLNQMAAGEFDEMMRSAASLMSLVRSREWNRSAEIATALRGGLAKATGSWPTLLNPSEKDTLKAASGAVKSLIEMVPVDEQADEQTAGVEKVQGMVAQCNLVIEFLGAIAGRLKYHDESEAKR